MFNLLLIIISYGALLVLLMPATGVGVLVVVAIFFIGTILMVSKRTHKDFLGRDKHYGLVLFSAFIAVFLGMLFYKRWIPYQWFPYSTIQSIANVLNITITKMLLIISPFLSLLSIYGIYVGLQRITQKLSRRTQHTNFVRWILLSGVAVITVISAQVMIGVDALSMGCNKFIWNCLIVLIAILLLYCLFGRIMPSAIIGAGIFMIISTINVYVYKFRQRLFEPVDVFSAGTAVNVAGNYSLFPIPLNIIIGWSAFAIVLVILGYVHCRNTPKLTIKRRLALMTVCVIGFTAISSYSSRLKTYQWKADGAIYNGYILDFASKIKEISAPEPTDYRTDVIDELAERYAEKEIVEDGDNQSDHTHIIVIMDEAFSDLSVIGEFSTNTEVMPYISSLKENTISGYALSSVYGGNTANSEYEFLTGNSMAWLSPDSVPYQQFIQSYSYSMVSYLKSINNYQCVAVHPYNSSGWNRPVAYEYLGFDECYFDEDLQPFEVVRFYASDQSMFESLIEIYESHKKNPLFLFGVTMQNHGGYKYSGENYTKSISLNDYPDEFPDVEQYLSLIHETDKAVEYLITYFQSVDEDVIIVFFGDHQPSLDEMFYETISGTTADTLDEQQKRYKVPFFIWANYDIEEEYIDCTSLNYLSSYVYESAGLALPPYNKFLQDMEATIPSINAYGFYSLVNEGYIPFNEANEDEQSWLKLYEALQYNNVFDKKNHNNILFPILD